MMSLPLNDIKKIIDQAFSSIGYEHQGLTVKLPSRIDVKIESKNNDVNLDFTNKLPVVSWKKFITMSALIQGMELNQTGGKIKIKYFPDINFLYEQPQLYGQTIVLDTGDIEQEIISEYPDDERQEIAKRCLHYANEWATICHSSGVTADDFRQNDRKLKRQCYCFVRDSIIEEKRHGSVIISFILIYVILPVVLKWIIEKLFKKLTS